MDAYKSPATIAANVTPKPQAWHLRLLKAFAIVLLCILAMQFLTTFWRFQRELSLPGLLTSFEG